MSHGPEMIRRLVILVFLFAAFLVMAISPRGVEARKQFALNRECCDFSLWQALRMTAREAIGGVTYPSEIGQDKWVIGRMFPGVANGFFLDVGSGHGTIGSNTKALEELGWTGICVDPFPTLHGRAHLPDGEGRRLERGGPGRQVPHARGSRRHRRHAWANGRKRPRRAPRSSSPPRRSARCWPRANAPSFIHFLSLDIEGAELEALRGVPFDKYRFGAMAIEHNDEEPKRSEIC